MKNFDKPGRWKRYILPCLLLAAVCVGAVELWVCAVQAPEVYAAVTAPVRIAVQRAGETAETAWGILQQRTDQAVQEGVSQVRAGLRKLDEYFSQLSEPDQSEASELVDELQEEAQLVDDQVLVTPPPRARADYSITALISHDGSDYLTGGHQELTYYDQTSEAWAEQPYGSDTIGRYGCGPTAMAMVVSTLAEDGMDPAQMARHCVDRGYWAKKHGSYWSIVPGVAEDFGLICTSLPPEETERDLIVYYLTSGQLLVALMGPGHFTNGGHFIILRGITLDGSVLVADPASPERSLITWDLDLILEELSSNRISGGPLWTISPDFFS